MKGQVSIWVRVQKNYDVELHTYVEALAYKISEGEKSEWNTKYYSEEGWVFVGEVEVGLATDHITIDHVKLGMVEGLRAKQQSIRAEAEKQCTDVQHQINQLLALTYEEPSSKGEFAPRRNNDGAEDVIPF